MSESKIYSAARALKAAEALLIAAGAGLGVDSGLPDFNGDQGFWKAYPPYKRLGVCFRDMACPATLLADPSMFWGFYEHRRRLYRETQPHAGYHLLLQLASLRSSFVFTSNVDGHFGRVGFSGEQIVECHGSIHHRQCAEPCSSHVWDVVDDTLAVDMQSMRADGPYPTCRKCRSPARPNILLFSDPSWVSDRADEQYGRYSRWLEQIRGLRLVVLELGAGTAVPTVRHEGERVASEQDGALIRINPREPDVHIAGAIGLQGAAMATLSALNDAIARL